MAGTHSQAQTGAARPALPYRAFVAFKWLLFALLALNIVSFSLYGDWYEAVDTVAWLILLGVFQYESTTLREAYDSPRQRHLLLGLQAIGYAMAVVVAAIYFIEGDWIDFANSVVWLSVCALISYDVYAPGRYGGIEWRVRNAIKAALYAALVGFALLWGVEGDWLDCYDALLWVLCFAVVELNIFKVEQPAAG